MARLLPSRLPAKPTALIGLGAAALATTIALPPTPWLVWNASASAPIGLYAVSGRQDIASGDMVLVRVPDRWRRLAAERGLTVVMTTHEPTHALEIADRGVQMSGPDPHLVAKFPISFM